MTSNPTITSSLIYTAREAFSSFLHSKLPRALPTPVEPPSPNADAAAHFDAVLTKVKTDEAWTSAAREKEEKFGMYITSLTRSSAAIRLAEERLKKGDTSGEAVKDLVDGAADVLGPYLGQTVS